MYGIKKGYIRVCNRSRNSSCFDEHFEGKKTMARLMRRPTLGMLKILHRCILSSSGGQEPQLRPLRSYLQTYRDMQRPDNVLRQPRTRTTSNRSSCRRSSHPRPILLKVRIVFQRRLGRNISHLARIGRVI